MKPTKLFFNIVFFAILLIGVNAHSKEIESKWISLYSKAGCLTGGQHWNKDYITEGSVFRQKEWQKFFSQSPKIAIPFLMDRLISTKSTQIHVCPFANATEGELALYVSEHISKKNWYDAGGKYPHLVKWSIKREESLTPIENLLLKDGQAISELKNYFLGEIQ